jgi:hypothetical protein
MIDVALGALRVFSPTRGAPSICDDENYDGRSPRDETRRSKVPSGTLMSFELQCPRLPDEVVLCRMGGPIRIGAFDKMRAESDNVS